VFGTPQNAMPCLCCLRADSARLAISVKNKPYVSCRMCGSKMFLNSPEALAGISLLAPRLMALLDGWRAAGVHVAAQTAAGIQATREKLDAMARARAT